MLVRNSESGAQAPVAPLAQRRIEQRSTDTSASDLLLMPGDNGNDVAGEIRRCRSETAACPRYQSSLSYLRRGVLRLEIEHHPHQLGQ
jgi:hypothetical protein